MSKSCQDRLGTTFETQGKPHLNDCHAARRDVLVDSIHVQTNDSSATGAAYEPANADGLDIDSCTDVVVGRRHGRLFPLTFLLVKNMMTCQDRLGRNER